MSAVITAVLIGAGLLALAIWVEIREAPAAPWRRGRSGCHAQEWDERDKEIVSYAVEQERLRFAH
jgi:hypothetical protein